jgi:hypothetical protein
MMMDETQERELIEALENLARWSRHYYLRLISEGFTPVEALALTRTWTRGIQTMTSGDE